LSAKAIKLIGQMVLSTIAREKDRTWDLYEKYILETRLHVPVREYAEWRKERTA